MVEICSVKGWRGSGMETVLFGEWSFFAYKNPLRIRRGREGLIRQMFSFLFL